MRTFSSGIFFLYCLAIVRAEQCIDKSTDDWKHVSEYRLTCGQNDLLMDVNVTAGTGNCKKSECKGSTPYMIENQYNCYWRQQCSIRVPKITSIDIIVRSSDQCFAQRPDFFRLSGALCTDLSKSSHIVDAVANFNATDKCNSDRTKTSGIIRSHHYYPWDYEGLVLFKGENSPPTRCFEIYRTTERDRNMVVTVRDLDLSSYDYLKLVTLGNGGAEKETFLLNNTSVGKTLVFSRSISAVRVIFHVDGISNGGRGFLLCYADVDFTDQNPDACSEISSSAIVEPLTGIDPFMLTDLPRTTVKTRSEKDAPIPVETCKECKKRCRKVPKKDKKGRKACRKSCKPVCKKSKGEKKSRGKGKRKDKNKNKKREKRMKEPKKGNK